jgi:hypothetical protein
MDSRSGVGGPSARGGAFVMPDSIRNSLLEEATVIRKRLDNARLPEIIGRFPRGCCGDVSTVLGVILKPRYEQVFYVSGKRKISLGKIQTHAWVQAEGVIVDITADQFVGMAPVIVTRDQTWHRSWKIETCEPAMYLDQASAESNRVWWTMFGGPLHRIMTGEEDGPPNL